MNIIKANVVSHQLKFLWKWSDYINVSLYEVNIKISFEKLTTLMTTWVSKNQMNGKSCKLRSRGKVTKCASLERRKLKEKKIKPMQTSRKCSLRAFGIDLKKVLFAYFPLLVYTLPLWIQRASGLIDFTILFPSPFFCCSAQFINKLCWDTQARGEGGGMENNWKHWRHFEAKSIKEM